MARREAEGQIPLYTRELLEPEDWSWLAPDRPTFYCMGKQLHLYGPEDEHEVHEPCGRLLPDLCFRPMGSAMYARQNRPVHPRCVACEQKISTAKNRLWYWERREDRAVGGHMRRERKQGLHVAQNADEYRKLGGLERGVVAQAMRYAATHDTKCSHCGRRWSEMPGGVKL